MNLGPMILSTRFKEAVKTALAMVIAFGVALAMDRESAPLASIRRAET